MDDSVSFDSSSSHDDFEAENLGGRRQRDASAFVPSADVTVAERLLDQSQFDYHI